MRILTDKRGLTLMETVIYMGILSVVMTAFLGVLTQMLMVHSRNSLRSRLAESAWTALNTTITSLETADAILSTQSTYDSDTGVLVFLDDAGATVAVDIEVSNVQLGNNLHAIPRLDYYVNNTHTYITDSDVEVYMWRIVPVRDSTGILTGLNLTLGVEVIDRQLFGYNQGRLTYTTTVSLNGQTAEL